MREIVPGILTWPWFSARFGYDFNGFLVRRPDGNLVIDPVDPTDDELATLAAEGVGISAGVEAMVAEAPVEWVRDIAALYGDERRWNEMSERGRAFVAANFSFEQGVRRMRAALAVAGVYTE